MKEENPKRQFKGVWIPVEIWDATDISWMEKCLLAEIDALDSGKGCYANNTHLAKRFGSTPGSIRVIVSRLRKLGYVRDVKFENGKRFIKVTKGVNRRLPAVLTGINTKRKQPLTKPVNRRSHIDTSVDTKGVTSLDSNPSNHSHAERRSNGIDPLAGKERPKDAHGGKVFELYGKEYSESEAHRMCQENPALTLKFKHRAYIRQ